MKALNFHSSFFYLYITSNRIGNNKKKAFPCNVFVIDRKEPPMRIRWIINLSYHSTSQPLRNVSDDGGSQPWGWNGVSMSVSKCKPQSVSAMLTFFLPFEFQPIKFSFLFHSRVDLFHPLVFYTLFPPAFFELLSFITFLYRR